MKKIISLFLAVTMIFTAVPTVIASEQSSASNNAKTVTAGSPEIKLEKAIDIIKQNFNIREDGVNFNSNYSTYQGRNQWNLNWNSKSEMSMKYYGASASIDAKTGEVISFNCYKSPEGTSKIPKITKEQALAIAQAFAGKINPEKFVQTKLQNESFVSNVYYYSDAYSFVFVRYLNEVPFVENHITVNVDKMTSEIIWYSLEWDVNPVNFEKGKITLDKAKDIIKNNLGLELAYKIYNNNEDSNKYKVVPVYTLKYGNKPIDAISGKIYKDGYFYIDGVDYYRNEKMKMDSKALTPEEQKEVDKNKKYISKEKALEIAKKNVKLEPGFNLSSANLNNDYTGLQNATWSLYWNYEKSADPKKTSSTNRNASRSCTIDAVTGDLRDFYIYDSTLEPPQNAKMKYDIEGAKKIADAYIKEKLPASFKDFEYRDIDLYNTIYEDIPRYYNFSYIAKKDSIYCPFNRVSINVDAYNGIINSYRYDWYNVSLPPVKNVITLDEAHNQLFTKLNFGLKYKRIDVKNNKFLSSSIIPTNINNTSKLVYYLDDIAQGITIDAQTGAFLGNNGEVIIDKTNKVFTDTENTPEKDKISVLAELNVIPSDSDKFLPNEKIKQKDLIKYLMRANDANSIDEYGYYLWAYNRGILEASEKNPDSTVTRLQMAKYLVNMMNLKKVAELNGIYKIPASDVKSADAGYCAIVNAYKMIEVQNDKFEPTKEMTRAEATGYIYNYLGAEK